MRGRARGTIDNRVGPHTMSILLRLAFFLFALFPGLVSAEPITLKLSFFTSDRTEAYQAAVEPFVDAVNAEANGLLHIRVYFSGALGSDQTKTAQTVLDGKADIALVITVLAPHLFYDNKIMEMPGLFHSTREATLVFTRLIAANALKGYSDFFVIGAFATAPTTIHTRSPVVSLKDLIGKKIGSNNATEGIALEKLGMHPVVLPVTKYAGAISSGIIDGVAKSPLVLFDFGIARFATYHYLLDVSSVPLALLMSRKKFDSLPKRAQDIIRKYSGEWVATRYIESVDEANKQALEKLSSDPRRKVIAPSQADIETAEDAFKSVVEEWAAKSAHNLQLLALVRAEIAKLRSSKETRP